MANLCFVKKTCNIFNLTNISTKKMVSSFPCLPVPPLLDTLKKLLTSAKPFTTPQEYCESERTIQNFGAPGGEGEHLQCLILERAETMDNWLVDWWQKYAFFGNRNSLIVSSTGLSFPIQDFNSDEDWLECASKIAAGALQFKKLIDENRVSQESIGDDPLDMSQYKKVFGTCRIPHDGCDYLIFNSKSEHIIVAFKNNFYKVMVKEGLAWQNHSAIKKQLKEIVEDRYFGPPLGILTSECRDTWYRAYTELRKCQINCDSIRIIEDSLFILCLDSCTSPSKINRCTSAIDRCIHGDGPKTNSCNRWFDKTLEFIVGKNGEIGITYEQSAAEIQVILMIMNFICSYIALRKARILPQLYSNFRETTSKSNMPTKNRPEKLNFVIDANTEDLICAAKCNLERLVADLDSFCFKFDQYGKNFLKNHEISADSYIQMAIQLAYYRLHQVVTPQFQLISIRKFKDGRSDVIRCCTEETVRFVCAMETPTLSAQSKANALYTALKCHQEIASEVMNGKGIDKHLFGLRVVACENNRPEPDIFCSQAYVKSSSMNLFTYQMISKFDGFISSGPSSFYGYTCFYKVGTGYINIAVSTCRSSQINNSYLFGQSLACSLNDMKEIINQAPSRI